MKNNYFEKMLLFSAIAGNMLFVLWILINGINESFKGTKIEVFSYITLMVLLIVNTFLLIRKKK